MTGIESMTQVLANDPMIPRFVNVRAYHAETADIFTLRLQPPEGYRFKPGQFNMVYAFGIGEAAISMSGDPEETGELVHTIRAVGSVTNALAKARAGDQVGVRGPFGSAWPVDEARGNDVVIVCGGIGLAPLRPVICYLLRHRAHYGKITVVVGVRSPADLAFRSEVDHWTQRPDLELLVTVDRAVPGWTGNVGMVTGLMGQIGMQPDRTIGLTCGPELMMQAVLREFARRGISDDRLYLSLERNMHCAIGSCGHCQFGPKFICMDGPVFRFDRIRDLVNVRDL
jgi:NAD(P)H-flavin reductase